MPSVNRSAPSKLIRSFNFDVPAGNTVDYDYISVARFNFTKFFVEIENVVTTETKVFTAHLAKLGTGDPDDNIFGKIGDNLNYKFNVLKIGSEIVIRVENNESDDIKVTIIRITI